MITKKSGSKAIQARMDMSAFGKDRDSKIPDKIDATTLDIILKLMIIRGIT